MRTIFAVYKRELAVYFKSITAYAIAFGFLFFYGLIISNRIASVTEVNIAVADTQALAQLTAGDILADGLWNLTFLMFLVAPLLTMRLLSEESREGTLEVLMTLPIAESRFIIGKFLAVWTFYSFMLLLTVVHTLVIGRISPLDSGFVLSAYLGAWLYGGAILALSMIWSAITDDQIVAAFLGATLILVLFLTDGLAVWASGQDITAGAVAFIREIGLRAHYHDTMLEGIIRLHDILYFVLLIIAGIFITTRLVETRRWRAL